MGYFYLGSLSKNKYLLDFHLSKAKNCTVTLSILTAVSPEIRGDGVEKEIVCERDE